MTFVDILLENISMLKANEIIHLVAEKWITTDHGITEEESLKYPQFMNDLLHIVDFDTALNHDSLAHFTIYCDELGFLNTIKALKNIKAKKEERILKNVFNMPEVQEIYKTGKKELSVEIMEKLLAFEGDMYISSESKKFWNLLESYVEKETYNYSLFTKNGIKN